jgi:arylformamidase
MLGEVEMAIWSALSTDEHELQYNPQRAVPDFNRSREKRDLPNTKAMQDLVCHRDIAYGDHPLRKLDIYPAHADRRCPTHVYLHGGYWRAQDKANFAFVAGTLVPLGITTVIVNYELCPHSTLDGVVDSAIAAMRWIANHIGDYGGDPDFITLSGHSAGAHLGAEIIAHDWASEGYDPDLLKGATLISGIFDPAPAIHTSVNAELGLTADIAKRHNVEERPPLLRCPVSIVAGGEEPWHWVDQSFRYYHHLRRNGFDPAVDVLPGSHHFNILDSFLDRDSRIMQQVCSHTLGRTTAPKRRSFRLTIYDLAPQTDAIVLPEGRHYFLYAPGGGVAVDGRIMESDEGTFLETACRVSGQEVAWLYEFADPDQPFLEDADIVLSRMSRPHFDGPYLLRADRIESTPGARTPRHGHRGPGMRRLVFGQLLAEVGDMAERITAGHAWYETGMDPVVGINTGEKNAAFVRLLVLPAGLQGGKSSFIAADASEAAKPRSVNNRLFGERLVE